MNPIDIVILAIVGVGVAAIIGYLIYKKVTGKGADCGCGFECGSCSHCSNAKNCNIKTDNN